MKMNIIDGQNKVVGSKDLPRQFSEEIREDIIRRAFIVLRSHKRQRYGAAPEAGKRHSTKLSRRRRDYKGSYGLGISRVPRKVHTKSGTRFNWVGAKMPGTVGGREAHPPKASKIWWLKINDKERKKAIRSALSACLAKDLVVKKHRCPANYPFIIDSSSEELSKAKDVVKFLENLGFSEEIERCREKNIRAGKGKMRGRKYKKKKGVLFVVSKECNLMKAANNIPGTDVADVKDINVELLAPGSHPGRLALFTKSAIEKMEKENLFF